MVRMRRKMKIKRMISVLALFAMVIGGPVSGAAEGTAADAAAYPLDQLLDINQSDNYAQYRAKHEQAKIYDGTPIQVDADSYIDGVDVEAKDGYLESDRTGAVLSAETGYIEWKFTVPEDALYCLEWDYAPVQGKNAEIRRELSIDGQVPFYEAANLSLSRFWTDDGGVTQDSQGNDVAPPQKEVYSWTTIAARDASGQYESPFFFYLTAGEHVLRLTSTAEPVLLGGFRLTGYEAPLSYADRLAEWTARGYQKASGDALLFEAEKAGLRSSASLYPIYDRSSAGVSPSDYSHIRINTIGGSAWQYPGSWIEWEVDAPQEGLYRIVLKARQNVSSGFYSSRALYVNGELPFREAQNLRFTYGDSWNLHVLGDEENGEYWIYLKEGANTLRLEATLGEMREIILQADTAVDTANTLYRQVLMLTGANPDPYRDYKIQLQLPGLVSNLTAVRQNFQEIRDQLLAQALKRGESTAPLERMITRLDKMIEDPEKIPRYMSDFKLCLTSMASWLVSAKQQPLEMDYILLAPEGAELPRANASFFENMAFGFLSYISSYFTDYSAIGNAYEGQNIDVWVSSGRDQANIINRMVERGFIQQNQIGVKLSLVNIAALMPSILAGRGPDVVLQLPQTDVVNYALRGAAVPLDGKPGFEELIDPLPDSAIQPFTYDGHVYGLAETQTFPMLFYRKDILRDLGVEKLDTWDDIYAVIPQLQKNGFQFGMPALSSTTNGATLSSSMNSYGIFLYQNGGAFYSEDGKRSLLDTEAATEAFERFTEFFTSYSTDISYDFATRFRTGEMPLGVADYTTYNLISVFAPEIEGLWGFMPVPGTEGENGIDRSVPAGSNGCMMLSTSDKQDPAWRFMRWWMNTDTQVQYGTELENTLGVAARYATANSQALERLAWTAEELTAIQAQRQMVKAIPEIPGSYYTARQIDFAFRQVVVSGKQPRDVLYDYSVNINQEIYNKRKEFGLPVDD